MRGFLPFFLIIIFMVVRISKELSKVNKSRPSTGMPPVPPEGERGARDISDFLQELKRLNQPAAQTREEQSAHDEQMALRERVRRAVRENREMKTKILDEPPPSPPPLVVSVIKPKSVVEQEYDAYSVVNTAAQNEKEAEQQRTGLDHPVFAGSLYDPMAIAKRAIVLREVMGPPVGLR